MTVKLNIIPFVPPPYVFNPVKHHLNLIKNFIIWGCDNRDNREYILEQINTIGDPVTDIYFGEYGVFMLKELLEKKLIGINAFNKEQYIEWLKRKGRDYNFLELDDNSLWTFRYGEKKDRYIHFHPAKYSRWSFRARGTTLRTAIAVKIFAPLPESANYSLDVINGIRREFLDLSPVKSVTPEKGIGKLLSIISDLTTPPAIQTNL